MALLQIAEPGQSSAPHEHRIAIGIDLGTTHSLVATVLSGQAKVLQDEKAMSYFLRLCITPISRLNMPTMPNHF